MDFGALLKKERMRSGLSQQALAAKCAVSPVYIYRMEKNGIDPPTRNMCRALAKAMRISEDVLWKPAFRSRLIRWLAKEGYPEISNGLVNMLEEALEKDRKKNAF
jgi:transcriptional regulator with XRE-family HTH domain